MARLFNQRKRQEEMVAAEAAGEDVWRRKFDDHARIGVWQILQATCRRNTTMVEDVAARAQVLLCHDERVHTLSGMSDRSQDFYRYLHQTANERQVASAIEALAWILTNLGNDYGARFETQANELLHSERIAYELVNSQIVELESQELHANVVVPTLRLLSRRPGWEEVERAYQEALHQVADGKYDNAITDAGTVLQEALEAAGCTGKNLGPLISDARQQGILGPHDSKLVTGVESIMEWVSADRSQSGDGHHGDSGATHEDAYFTIHVVGALILRLASGGKRVRE
jgi:hypothetical protein